MYRVFTYGTLKRGQINNYLLHEGEVATAGLPPKFLGQAVTIDTWPLIIAGRFNIPFLLDKKGMGQHVYGEVYEVDEKVLAALDKLENHPVFYERGYISVKMVTNENGAPAQEPASEIFVYGYIMKNFRHELLQNATFNDYDSYGSHGLQYMPPNERSHIPLSEFIGDIKIST